MKIKSIKTKLLILLLGIIVVSSLLLGTIAYRISKSALERSVEATITTISEKIAQQVRQENERKFHMLDVLANTAIMKDPDISSLEKSTLLGSATKVDSQYVNIAYYDKNGDSMIDDGTVINFSNREYFKRAIAGEHYVSHPSISPVNGQLLIFYSVPVHSLNGSDCIGAIIAVCHGETLSDMCKDIFIGKESHPFIIDMKTGKTVADADVKYVIDGQVLLESTSGQMKEAIRTTMDGVTGYHTFFEPWRKKEMVAAYRPVGDVTNWAVFCMAPYAEYFGSIDRMVRTMVISIAILVIIAIVLSTLVIKMIVSPLKAVESSITGIASGNADLTQRIEVTSHDEIGNVVNGFNQFTEKLQAIIGDVKHSKEELSVAGTNMSFSAQDTAASITEIIANIQSMHDQISNQVGSVNQTATAVNEIASNIESLERMIETQSSGVTAASAAVEEMIGNIASVNQSVDKMANSFKQLEANAQNGISKQQAVDDQIKQIEQQSAMLQEANTAISSIAEQTNLLAMNAAIEAAHAGEAGKGFAVVADEIRKLSETSSQQSKTIGDQLKNIQSSIAAVVNASADSSSAFSSVSRQITETDQLVSHIKSAMEEQQTGSQQITDSLHNMNDSTAEVRTAAAEMSEGNKAILQEVGRLQNYTGAMKGSMDEMAIGATKINETGATLGNISDQVKESIVKIGNQIDQFKV